MLKANPVPDNLTEEGLELLFPLLFYVRIFVGFVFFSQHLAKFTSKTI